MIPLDEMSRDQLEDFMLDDGNFDHDARRRAGSRRRRRGRGRPSLPEPDFGDEAPADWMRAMTVCIAATSGFGAGRRNVLVSDLKLSTAYGSLESSTLKLGPLTPEGRWAYLYSGVPGHADAIIERVQHAVRNGASSGADISLALTDAYSEVLRQKIESSLLCRFGWSEERFLDVGLRQLGAHEFARLLEQVKRVRLGTELLVTGFEPLGAPRLLGVKDPGEVDQHQAAGFHAIGSGALVASGHLYATYNENLSTTDLIYRVCEAKFLAEVAHGVGRRTFAMVQSPTGECGVLEPAAVDQLRQVWERHRSPVPADVGPIIIGNLSSWRYPNA